MKQHKKWQNSFQVWTWVTDSRVWFILELQFWSESCFVVALVERAVRSKAVCAHTPVSQWLWANFLPKKLRHWFSTSSEDGSTWRLLCWFSHPTTTCVLFSYLWHFSSSRSRQYQGNNNGRQQGRFTGRSVSRRWCYIKQAEREANQTGFLKHTFPDRWEQEKKGVDGLFSYCVDL